MLIFADERTEEEELHTSATLGSVTHTESQRLEPKDEEIIHCDKQANVPMEICSPKTPAATPPHHPTPDQIGEEIDRQLSIMFGDSTESDTTASNEMVKSELESFLWEIQRYDPNAKPPVSDFNKPNSNQRFLHDSASHRGSWWSSELHTQRLLMQETYQKVAKKGKRHTVRLRRRMDDLFGVAAVDDSSDENCEESSDTSTSIHPILMAGCLKRIAPWLVKHLMRPMQHDLIESRDSFINVARQIGQRVLELSQYPGGFSVFRLSDDCSDQRRKPNVRPGP